ncbi:MAG: hypothetical protein QW220_04005 [Candidatus Bathyarchaeia archaeon]
MGKQKRIIMLEKTLLETLKIAQLDTQNLRIKLIENLERIFLYAKEMASSPLVENREEWIRICGYIAQTINSLANSFDEVRFSEDMERLRGMIERAKKRAGLAGEGTPVA